MKKITQFFKVLTVVFAVALSARASAQSCAVNFSVNTWANGAITFTAATTSFSPANATYYWSFGNGATYTATGWPGYAGAYTYTANGTYVITLFVLSTVPSCSTSAQQTVVINSVGSSSCNLTGGFTYTTGSNGFFQVLGTSNYSVASYQWSFGNGYTTTGQLSGTTYTANGNYVVTMTVSLNSTCTAVYQQTVNITTATGCALSANFSATQAGNGNVSFNNTTTGAGSGVTYAWAFGDGNTSSLASPINTYTANGVYQVTLTANNNTSPACVSTKTLFVTVNSVCNLVASFSYTLGNNGLVLFKSTSTGTTALTSYTWNFGTGPVATGVTASHTFTNGSYNVMLAASANTISGCLDTAMQVITVTSNTCQLQAGFVATQGTNGLVTFSNTSTNTTGGTTYTWSFGNGFTSTLTSPSATYVNGGTYFVTLYASNNNGCTSTTSQSLSITSVSCLPNANFTLAPTNVPQFWVAVPAYPYNVIGALWSWGDGATTYSLYGSHQYSVAGNYNICLSVTVSCGGTASTCATYSVYRTNMDMVNVNVVAPGEVDIETTVPSHAASLDMQVFPNPADGRFYISGNLPSDASLEVSNLLGEIIYSHALTAGKANQLVDLHAQSGIYILRVRSDKGEYTSRIIVNK